MIDQEFSKRGPSQGSGTKQNEANSEAKCEISVRVQFITFSCIQNLGYNVHAGAELVQYFCANTQLKTFNGG